MQYAFIGFDELTHFNESMLWYMFSRNRTTCGIKQYIRATTNPDVGWVKRLLAPWVDTEFSGTPAKSGELRWFIRSGGKLKWVPEGTPHAKSLTFISARVTDNQVLMEADPGYRNNLMALPDVERRRLLDGDWDILHEGLVYPEFLDCLVEADPWPRPPEVGGMDFGVRNAFVALSGYVDHDDVLWVTDCYYSSGKTIPEHSPNLPLDVDWAADPAGAEQIMQLKQAGHSVRPCAHSPVRGATGEVQMPLAGGISMVRERMRTGRLKIVRTKCLPLVRELGAYIYDPDRPEDERPLKKNDHSPDALRYMIVTLDRGQSVPSVWTPERREAREQRWQEQQEGERIERQLASWQVRVNFDAVADPWNDRWWN